MCNRLVAGRIEHLEGCCGRVTGYGHLSASWQVADVLVGEAARGDFPALVVIGVDVLQLELIEVIRYGSIAVGIGQADHRLRDEECADLVTLELGDLPDDVVPGAGLEVMHEVHRHRLRGSCRGSGAHELEVELVERLPGLMDITPERDAVEGDPVLRRVEGEPDRTT